MSPRRWGQVQNLLLHDAGFPPDPSPGYSDPAFGCPGTAEDPPPEDFSCAELVYDAILAQVGGRGGGEGAEERGCRGPWAGAEGAYSHKRQG